MSKTLRFVLTIALLWCMAFPIAACSGSKGAESGDGANEGRSITAAELVGTVWYAPGDGTPEDFGFWFEFPSEERCYLMWVYHGGIDGVAGFDYSVHGCSLVQDGRQTGSIAPDLSKIELTFPDGSSHVFVPDDRKLTSQEDFEDMLTYLDPLFNEDGTRFKTYAENGDNASANSSSTGANDAKKSAYEDQVVSAAGIEVRMPGSWAAKGLYWTVDERFQQMVLEYALNGDRVQIAEIDWGERASLPYEADDELWTLGNVTAGGAVRPAVLHIMYVDSEGKTYSANTTVSDATLASEYFLGLSPEEIISWIHISEAEQSASSSGLSSRRQKFCGVWAYASKDLGEALDFADDAQRRGFAAEVFLTTDWSNLNSEPWYVVSLGCTSSEAEADRVLQAAHGSGYGDAYVKWSGDYIG